MTPGPQARAEVQRAPRRAARAAPCLVPPENILQLLPDAVVPSKAALKTYWRKAASAALPYLARRPLKLARHTHDTTFYHGGKLPPTAPGVHELRIEKREGGEGVRLWVDDLEGLLGLVDMDVVELHPWDATIDDIEHPDQMILDLDPGPGVAWEFVIERRSGCVTSCRTKASPPGRRRPAARASISWRHSIARAAPTRFIETRAGWREGSRHGRPSATSSPPRLRIALASSSSTICATAAARRRSAPIRQGCAPASRSPRPSPGQRSSAASDRTPTRCAGCHAPPARRAPHRAVLGAQHSRLGAGYIAAGQSIARSRTPPSARRP